MAIAHRQIGQFDSLARVVIEPLLVAFLEAGTTKFTQDVARIPANYYRLASLFVRVFLSDRRSEQVATTRTRRHLVFDDIPINAFEQRVVERAVHSNDGDLRLFRCLNRLRESERIVRVDDDRVYLLEDEGVHVSVLANRIAVSIQHLELDALLGCLIAGALDKGLPPIAASNSPLGQANHNLLVRSGRSSPSNGRCRQGKGKAYGDKGRLIHY